MHQEITEGGLEPVDIAMELVETDDKCLYLRTNRNVKMVLYSTGETYNVLVDMREGRLEKVGSVLPQEYGVRDIRIRYSCRVEQRNSNLVLFNKLEHSGQEHALKLETTLVICVRENIQYILHNVEEVLLEERIRDFWFGTGKVVDNLQTHYEEDVSSVMKTNL